MKIRRFVARDMRTALAEIKEELGAEAVIMSNKKIPEGVELMAAIDYSHSTPSSEKSQVEVANHITEVKDSVYNSTRLEPEIGMLSTEIADDNVTIGQQQNDAPVDSLQALLNRKVQKPEVSPDVGSHQENSIEQQLKNFTDRLQQSEVQQGKFDNTNDMQSKLPASTERQFSEINSSNIQQPQIDSAASKSNIFDANEEMKRMQQEMASIRQLLEHQVSGLMWQDMAQKDPSRALLVNKLLDLGISEEISDQIAGYVPDNMSEDAAWENALGLMAQQLNTTNNDIIQRGGVVSLVGPTGVGKTTTIAKLAARFAQLHGADQVALISTDTFRIAGFEQLETYGRIIGCNVKLAKDAQVLDTLIQEFSSKKLILIDTAGMGQRDMRLAEHLATLVKNSRVRIRNYLVLAANSQQAVLQENVERFKKIPLCGCIYTKLDESLSVGEIISTSIQNGLPIGYLTDGQRVPEDIKVANTEKLVSLAEKMVSRSTIKRNLVSRSVYKGTAAIS